MKTIITAVAMLTASLLADSQPSPSVVVLDSFYYSGTRYSKCTVSLKEDGTVNVRDRKGAQDIPWEKCPMDLQRRLGAAHADLLKARAEKVNAAMARAEGRISKVIEIKGIIAGRVGGGFLLLQDDRIVHVSGATALKDGDSFSGHGTFAGQVSYITPNGVAARSPGFVLAP